jgi:hypothetical protein
MYMAYEFGKALILSKVFDLKGLFKLKDLI